MRRIGPRSSAMLFLHTRIAWRRWSPPRKRKRRFTGYSRARRTRCAARWRKPSRTPVTDDHTILDVPGWSGGVATTTGYLCLAVGRRERRAHRIRLGGTRPVAHETVSARTDGCPQPEPSVQAGGVDERGPVIEDLGDGEFPGLHRGRRSGPDAGRGAAIGRRQGAFQGSSRPAVRALAGTPRETRRGEVARF